MGRTSKYAGKMANPISATLTPVAFALLKRLEQRLHLSRADTVEEAIREKAARTFKKR